MKQIRENKGLTRMRVSTLIKKNVETIAAIENGHKKNITMDEVVRFATAYNLPIEEIYSAIDIKIK